MLVAAIRCEYGGCSRQSKVGMTQALEDFDRSVEVGGRSVTNLRFADDIDQIADSTDELRELSERLDRTSREFSTKIG